MQDKDYPRTKRGTYKRTTGNIKKYQMRVTYEEKKLILEMRTNAKK